MMTNLKYWMTKKHDKALKALVQAQRKQNCIGLPYRYKYPRVAMLVCLQKLGGSRGMLPQENVFGI